jgi:hypothetical protein
MRYLLPLGLLLVGFGCVFFIIFVREVGGIGFWLSNVQGRGELLRGRGYVSYGMYFLQFGTITLFCAWGASKSKASLLAFICALIVVALLGSLLGGRAHLLRLLCMLLVVWNFRIHRLRFGRPWLIAASVAVLSIYFIGLEVVRRQPDGFMALVNRPTEVADQARNEYGEVLQQFSYVPIYLFVCDYFRPHNIWLGASYADLATGLLPRALVGDSKPPVDEGMYIATAATGRDVQPSVPADELYSNSLPPETLGVGMANFYVPGAIALFAILGVVHALVYRWFLKSRGAVFAIVTFSFTVFQFQLTNLRMIQFALLIASAAIVLYPLCQWKRASI